MGVQDLLRAGNMLGSLFNGGHMRRTMTQAGKSPAPVIGAEIEHALALQLFCNR